MNPRAREEVVASRAKQKILDALSERPRTLGELSSVVGISVQGVLRHLKRLVEVGAVEERNLSRVAPKARLVYAARGLTFRDFSAGDLTVMKSTETLPRSGAGPKAKDLERASGEILIKKRRIRDEARKLGRMIDDIAADQGAISSAIGGLPLEPKEKLILEVLLTEDTFEDGERVLAEYYGLDDRRSIESVLAKAKRSVGR